MEKNQIPQELQESLKRYRELLGYDVEKGKLSLTERHVPYQDNIDYAEGDEDKEGGDNADFDFGGGEDTGGEEGGDSADFDFGGGDAEGGENTEGGDNADFDFGGGEDTEGGDTEEETDEFGTADEFSAADEIETDEDGDVEEIDVTDIVKRADDAKGYAEKAVTAAEEGTNMIKDLMSKFQELEKSLGAINTVRDEVTSIKKDLQAQKPKEKLELRSLDSYPFNVKLTDYWNDEKLKSNYEITDGSSPDAQSPDGEVKVWKVTPEDTKNWNSGDIQKSFIPESKLKKKDLTEDGKVDDINRMFNSFNADEGKIKKIIQYLVQGRDSEASSFGNTKLVSEIKKYLNQIPSDKMEVLKKKKGEEIQNIFSGDALKKLVEYLKKQNLM